MQTTRSGEKTVNSSELDSKKMTREEALALPNEAKMNYLFELQVRHAKLESIGRDLLDLISPYNEVKIISIIGATGVGKTTLSRRLIRSLVSQQMGQSVAHRGQLPYVFINAPANGDKSISWRAVYEMALRNASEPLVNKKIAVEENDGHVFIRPGNHKTLPALRQALEEMLKNRGVRVLAIDEAFHLLRFGNYSAVMDTLKSLADETNVKLVLLGTYDLFDLAVEYGQVARRSEILHFERYDRDKPVDVAEYKRIIRVLQDRWPCEEIPNFGSIAPELMKATLGCIGLLKALFLRSLAAQIQNKGRWKPAFLTKAAKSMSLVERIRKEIEAGEAKLRGGTYGESIFAGELLHTVSKKMSGNDEVADAT